MILVLWLISIFVLFKYVYVCLHTLHNKPGCRCLRKMCQSSSTLQGCLCVIIRNIWECFMLHWSQIQSNDYPEFWATGSSNPPSAHPALTHQGWRACSISCYFCQTHASRDRLGWSRGTVGVYIHHKRIHTALYHAAYVTLLRLPTEKCYNYRADNQSGPQHGGGWKKFHANYVKWKMDSKSWN